MRTIDAVKLVVAAVVALVLVLVALVARTVLLFRLLFALTLGVLGVLIVTGSRGLLPKKVA